MKPISVDEFPQYSVWPRRLLGIEPWQTSIRTTNRVEDEYNAGKYGRCLTHYDEHDGQLSPEEVRDFECQYATYPPICLSVKNRLFEATLRQASDLHHDLFLEHLGPHLRQSSTVMEMGCGYGYNLWDFSREFQGVQQWLGGEYASSAVELAEKLYRNTPQIRVLPFNFYDPESYRAFFETAQTPVTIFTSHAIEQLPSAEPVLDALSLYADKIAGVFHFEPVHEKYDNSLLGLMQRRYTVMNDYNRDLLSQIEQRPEIKICKHLFHQVGINPLNPTSVIHWEFI